jgi:hypothetical protein
VLGCRAAAAGRARGVPPRRPLGLDQLPRPADRRAGCPVSSAPGPETTPTSTTTRSRCAATAPRDACPCSRARRSTAAIVRSMSAPDPGVPATVDSDGGAFTSSDPQRQHGVRHAVHDPPRDVVGGTVRHLAHGDSLFLGPARSADVRPGRPCATPVT